MTIEDIKLDTLEVNELGNYIIRVSSLLEQMPKDLQPTYAEQLLIIISEYYKVIDKLKKSIEDYQKNDVVDISITRLKKSLDKFDRL
jgi:hypothetical protein